MEKKKLFNFSWDWKNWSLGLIVTGGAEGVGVIGAIGPFAFMIGTI